MTIIIAEAGVNHNGDIGLAYQLVDAAAEAGADIVKFQTFANQLVAEADKASYQKETTSEAETQRNMLPKSLLRASCSVDRLLQSNWY